MRKILVALAVLLLAGVSLAPVRNRSIFPQEHRKYFIHNVDDFAGNVLGPSSSTDTAIARFDGTAGTLLQDSGITLSDSDIFSALITDANNIGIRTAYTPASPSESGVTGTVTWDTRD